MHPVKENLLRVIRDHKKPEWTPSYLGACFNAGLAGMDLENGPPGGGEDAFGVRWVGTTSTGGALTPDPHHYVLDDITRWKEVVTFPDVWKFDWESYAQRAYPAFFDPDKMVKGFSVCGPFQRMEALMGFENCLCDMAMEPEATYEFMCAVAEYNMEMVKAAKKYLGIEMFDLADDIATEQSLFMSPDCYREFIKPNHKKVYDLCRNEGLIVEQHTCGKADVLIDDYVELGIDVWQSVQPTNDIEGILQKYGDRLALVGGFDSNGAVARAADDEQIIEEIHRCFDTYGKYDSYVFWGFFLRDDPKTAMHRMDLLTQESQTYPRKLRGLE